MRLGCWNWNMLLDVEAHVPVWRTLEIAVLDVVMDLRYRRLQVIFLAPLRFGRFSP